MTGKQFWSMFSFKSEHACIAAAIFQTKLAVPHYMHADKLCWLICQTAVQTVQILKHPCKHGVIALTVWTDHQSARLVTISTTLSCTHKVFHTTTDPPLPRWCNQVNSNKMYVQIWRRLACSRVQTCLQDR